MAIVTTRYYREEAAPERIKYGLIFEQRCYRLTDFKTGLHDLRDEHRLFLNAHVLTFLQSDPGSVCYIVGHASKRGTAGYDNQALSERRAAAVARHLEQFGVGPRVHVKARGATAAIGTYDDDPVDRAAVLVLQKASLPQPRFLDPPVEVMSVLTNEWYIVKLSARALKIPGVSFPTKVQAAAGELVLEQPSTRTTATYTIKGVAAGSSYDLKQVPYVGAYLDKANKMLGLAKLLGLKPPTVAYSGTRIATAPYLLNPTARDFEGSIAISKGSSGFYFGTMLALVVFSKLPPITPMGALSIKGVGGVAATSLTLGAGVEIIYGDALLASVAITIGSVLPAKP